MYQSYFLSDEIEEDDKLIIQPVIETINKEKSEELNVDTNSEGPVELEWNVEINTENDDKEADDDGQMKIF